MIPWTTFTDPEVARVGLNEQEAKEQGIAYEVTRYGIDDLDRAIADGAAHGFVKVLTVPGKDRILGVTIVGEHAGDLLAEIRAGDEARPRAQQDPRHDPHLSDAGRGEQIRGGRMEAGACARARAGLAAALSRLEAWLTAALKLSVVVPVLNEARALPALLECLLPLRRTASRSSSSTVAATMTAWPSRRAAGMHVLRAERGRARQMNAGAAAVARRRAAVPARRYAAAGRRRATDRRGARRWPRMPGAASTSSSTSARGPCAATAFGMNLRSRLTGIATGDQALFMTRAAFDGVGGFPDQPLMEDVEITRRLRQRSRPACIRRPVLTSARRWEARGAWRTIFLMWRLRLDYWLGASPADLARRYR